MDKIHTAVMQDLVPERRLESGGGHDIDVNMEQVGQFPLQPGQRHEADTRVKVDKQIDVTVIGVFASGDAAEDTHVACPAPSGNLGHRAPVPTKTPAKSRVGQPKLIPRCGNQLEGELMAGSFDQLGQGTKTRITLIGFICADH